MSRNARTTWMAWRLLLLGAASACCIGCDGQGGEGRRTRPPERREEGRKGLPSRPAGSSPVSRPHKKTDMRMSDAIVGRGVIAAAGDRRYRASFVLKNVSAKVAVMDLGPLEGGLPDGNAAFLVPPGVHMAVSKDGQWEKVNDQMTLGERWNGVIRIQPGGEFAWAVEFHVIEGVGALLKAGAPAALVIRGYSDGSLANVNVSGELAVPLGKKAGQSGGL